MADQTSKNMEYLKKTWIGGLFNMILGQIKTLQDTPPGSAAWGSIATGTGLSSQTDLQSALDAKADAADFTNVDNVQQMPLSYLDIDDTLAADSDTKVASQKATKAYVDNNIVGGSGKVLQVLQTVKSDTWTTSSSTFSDVTGLSVTITPSASDSKILCTVNISLGQTSNQAAFWKILRDSTEIAPAINTAGYKSCFQSQTNNDANIVRSCSFTILDAPASTSALTYKVQVAAENNQTATVNRSGNDTANQVYSFRNISSITVQEIAA